VTVLNGCDSGWRRADQVLACRHHGDDARSLDARGLYPAGEMAGEVGGMLPAEVDRIA